jgi:hypothetical protein
VPVLAVCPVPNVGLHNTVALEFPTNAGIDTTLLPPGFLHYGIFRLLSSYQPPGEGLRCRRPQATIRLVGAHLDSDLAVTLMPDKLLCPFLHLLAADGWCGCHDYTMQAGSVKQVLLAGLLLPSAL